MIWIVINRNHKTFLWRFNLILSWIYFFPLIVDAQVGEVDNQIWTDVIPHFDISKRLDFYGDGSYRTSISGSKFRRFVLRPSIRYYWFTEINLHGGVGLFITQENEDVNTIELRPFQAIRINWPDVWRINFKHRVMVEERLIWDDRGNFEPALRLRYRISGKVPINKLAMQYKALYIPIGFELFGNIGGESIELFANTSRVITGLGYVFSDDWIFEFNYIGQRSRSNDDEDLKLADRIFRFKLIYNGWIFGE